MKLLLVRHGPAADRDLGRAKGGREDLRPLTDEGRARTRAAVRGLVRVVDAPDALATSPLSRAVQTADVVARAFELRPAARLASLAPSSPPADLLPWLREHTRAGLVACVGHEPHLGRLASWLLTGEDRSFVHLRKAGAALLDLGPRPEPGKARLEWLLAPAQLRRLGR